MTLAHHAPALHAPDLASALDALRARGLRISASRRQVLEALYADSRPRRAEELAKDGDLASVYRNLDTLEEVGLVRHVHLGHGPGLYSLAGAARTSSSSPASAAAPTRPSSRSGSTAAATRSSASSATARASPTSRSSASAPTCQEDEGHAHP